MSHIHASLPGTYFVFRSLKNKWCDFFHKYFASEILYINVISFTCFSWMICEKVIGKGKFRYDGLTPRLFVFILLFFL